MKCLSASHASPGQVISMDGEGLSSGKEEGWRTLISPAFARVVFSRLRGKCGHEPAVPMSNCGEVKFGAYG